jgi:hypothetical protein
MTPVIPEVVEESAMVDWWQRFERTFVVVVLLVLHLLLRRQGHRLLVDTHMAAIEHAELNKVYIDGLVQEAESRASSDLEVGFMYLFEQLCISSHVGLYLVMPGPVKKELA